MPLRLFGGALARVMGSGTAIALIVGAGAWLYHGWQTGRLQSAIQDKQVTITELRTERDQWRASAQSHQQRAARQEALRKAADSSVRQLQAVLAEREQSYQAERERLRDSPVEDDGPVAPVLRETLEGLP